MAKRGMEQRLAGGVLMAVGAALGVWGYRDSQSVPQRVADALGAGVSEEVLVFYLAGVACLAAGVFLLVRR